MRKHLFTLLAALALVSGTLATGAQAARPKSKHVVLIALDGWGAYSVPKADIPHIRSLMERGCYTLKSRSILPSSIHQLMRPAVKSIGLSLPCASVHVASIRTMSGRSTTETVPAAALSS